MDASISSWINSHTPLLDIRDSFSYQKKHIKGSTNIPFSALMHRLQDLPPRGRPISLLGSPHEIKVAQEYISQHYLIKHKFEEGDDNFNNEFWIHVNNKGILESGDISVRLWSPSPFLEEMIPYIEEQLPQEKRTALDIACGFGRDCIYLAMRGWNATGVDNDERLLTRASESASREKCSITTIRFDLEEDEKKNSRETFYFKGI